MKSRVMAPKTAKAVAAEVKVAKKAEVKEVKPKLEVTREQKALTVVQLKAALTEKGIEFKSTDKKADLLALIAKA